MLRRSIDLNPIAPTFQEESFRYGKRTCAALGAVALTIGILDLMNVAVVEAAATFINESYQQFAELPHQMRPQVNLAPQPPLSPSAVESMASPAIPTKQDMPVVALQSAPMKFSSLNSRGPPALEVTPASVLAARQIPEAVSLRAASGERLPSPTERLHLSATSLAKAERCLANAIYFEAQDEPVRGQIAVAQVVLNRVFSGFYPRDVCGVVYQNANRLLDCQFTFACDGKRKAITEPSAWTRANRIAARSLAGDFYDTAVGTSTHYHALYVHPEWANGMRKLARYGLHNFYRPIAWGNGSKEPVWGPAPAVQKLPLQSSTQPY